MDTNKLFSRYFRKGILVDTNILLLYLVGQTNRERISKFNHLGKFSAPWGGFELIFQNK